MVYHKTTKFQQDKVMKVILDLRTPFENRVIIDKSFYARCGLSQLKTEACLNALAANGFIELVPPLSNTHPTVVINQSAYTYFPDEKKDNFRFWIPLIITNLIAASALIVAILAYIKQ